MFISLHECFGGGGLYATGKRGMGRGGGWGSGRGVRPYHPRHPSRS